MNVTLCYTQTLDGRIATAAGESQWIGGGESVQYWHQLRAEHDAVMVGVGTVLADNPRLTVRHVAGRDPLRVVVDSTLRTPLDAAVLASGAASNTLIATTHHASAERQNAVVEIGATVLPLSATAKGQVELPVLFAALAERGVRSVMVEGGAQLITSLLREHLAGRAVVCIAPRFMGSGTNALGDIGVKRLSDMPTLADVKTLHFGDDVVFDGRIAW